MGLHKRAMHKGDQVFQGSSVPEEDPKGDQVSQGSSVPEEDTKEDPVFQGSTVPEEDPKEDPEVDPGFQCFRGRSKGRFSIPGFKFQRKKFHRTSWIHHERKLKKWKRKEPPRPATQNSCQTKL